MSGQPPVLDVRNLSIRLSDEFGVVIERIVLDSRDVVVLDAPSGAGKSTVLGLISGAIAPTETEGSVHQVAGHPVEGQVPGPGTLGFVLQTSTLVPYLTVEENITLPCRVADIAYEGEWLDYLLRGLGLMELKERKPQHISVGQRQRVGIARAFLSRPELLLLDEPVSALDPSNVDQVERLIALLAEEAGTGIVLASHQAARGAFANKPRARHSTELRDGALFSVFKTEEAA